MTTPPIEVRGLVKRFGEREVLAGVDLRVERGQILGYIGPNGAGKSTTVKILAGLLGGFRGEVRVAGFDPRLDPVEVKRRVGYLPETPVLYEALSVAEFLLLVGHLHGLESEAIERRAGGFLEELGLSERLDSRLGSLSKGMRQKVLLTAALVHDPEILFVDEPLSGLDVSSALLVKELLRGLAGRGRVVFYCSHAMDVVERVCDRIAILDRGRIVAEGSFEELSARVREPSLERVFAQVTEGGGEAERAQRLFELLS